MHHDGMYFQPSSKPILLVISGLNLFWVNFVGWLFGCHHLGAICHFFNHLGNMFRPLSHTNGKKMSRNFKNQKKHVFTENLLIGEVGWRWKTKLAKSAVQPTDRDEGGFNDYLQNWVIRIPDFLLSQAGDYIFWWRKIQVKPFISWSEMAEWEFDFGHMFSENALGNKTAPVKSRYVSSKTTHESQF